MRPGLLTLYFEDGNPKPDKLKKIRKSIRKGKFPSFLAWHWLREAGDTATNPVSLPGERRPAEDTLSCSFSSSL